MNSKLLSVIGSAALFSTTLITVPAQTANTTTTPAPPATPAPEAPSAPAAAVPAAPATAATTPAEPAVSNKKMGRLQAKLEKVSAAVGLTTEQQPKVLAIYKEEEKQIMAERTADKALPKDQVAPKITAIRDAADAKIVALLTPDQNKKYTEYKHHKA